MYNNEMVERTEQRVSINGERPPITHAKLVEKFGHDYREEIIGKARQTGLKSELVFLDPAVPHTGSKAVYIVEQADGENLIKVSVLEEDDESSSHRHSKGETYLRVRGILDGELERDSFTGKFELSENSPSVDVPMSTWHKVKARKGAGTALTFIVMWGAALLPPDEVHERRNLPEI